MRKKIEREKIIDKIIYYFSYNFKFILIKLLCKAKIIKINVEN